jgi:cytochrome c oxidase subunit I
MLSRRLGTIHFWLVVVGFNLTFFFMHILGREGMARRVADYEPTDGFERWNMIASIGALVLTVSFVPFVIAIVKSFREPPTAGADPWHANSLEWATSSPPPAHNFTWLPPIRSERPVFDLRWSHHPEYVAPGMTEAWAARGGVPPPSGNGEAAG